MPSTLSSRLDTALHQTLAKFLAATSTTVPASLATPLYPQQHNDWRQFRSEAYTLPPMPETVAEILHEIIGLLDNRADLSLVRDPKADEIIRDTLNELLNRGTLVPMAQQQGTTPGDSVNSLHGLNGNKQNGSTPPLGSANMASSPGGASARDKNSLLQASTTSENSPLMSTGGALEAINPIEASIHLCDAIYDIQYSDAATRHTRLCRHLIHILTLSPHEQHIRFASSVYRKILNSVAMAQKASQLKRKAHVGQGRLAQMNEAATPSQHFLSSSHDEKHTAATGMELAKLNIVNVWEELAKEIKELCENVLRHSQGRGLQQQQQRAPSQALGLLVILQITFPFLPTNCSVFQSQHNFRATVLAVASHLAGVPEASVRHAACECLETVLGKHIRNAEVQAETNHLFETSLRALKQGNCPENVAVGVCITIKSILAVRGPPPAIRLTSPYEQNSSLSEFSIPPKSGGGSAPTSGSKVVFDHAQVAGLCSTALELNRNTRQPSVKSALAFLFPYLARVDPQFEARKASYVDAIIEPLKNIRDLDRKAQELYNFYVFVQTIGDYDTLKHDTRVNFESVLLRLMSSTVVPGQALEAISESSAQQLTLPTACWFVIGAIFRNRVSTNLSTLVERDCIPLIQHTVLTTGLLDALKLIKEGTALFAPKFEEALHRRSKDVLVRTAAMITVVSQAPSPAPRSPVEPHRPLLMPQQQHQQQQQPQSKHQQQQGGGQQGTGFLSSWWNNGSNSNNSPAPGMPDGRSGVTSGRGSGDATPTGSNHPAGPLASLQRPAHIEEVICAMDLFAKMAPAVYPNDTAEAVACSYWRDINMYMLPLLAHPVATVRAQCGKLLGSLFRSTIIRAYPVFGNARRPAAQYPQSNTSPLVAPFPSMSPAITLYARAGMVPFIIAFSKRIVFEIDTRVKVSLLHSISGGTSGMLIPGQQGAFPSTHSELIPQEVIEVFSSLLNHVRRIREASLEVLLGVGGTNGVPSARAHESLKKTVSMHIQVVSHLQDPQQIACSCSTLTLLFEHRPTLMTTEILSSLVHASCGKLRQLYGVSSAAAIADPASQLQGLGVYDSQVRHRALLSLQEGEEYIKNSNSNNSPVNASGPQTPLPPRWGESNGSPFPQGKVVHYGMDQYGGKVSPQSTLSLIAFESAQTIVLLELINQLLIAGKLLQRQRLASVPPPTDSPTTKGTNKAFPGQRAPTKAPPVPTPSPVLALTESSETRGVLRTLWCCLLQSTRTINIVSSVSNHNRGPSARGHAHGVAPGSGEGVNGQTSGGLNGGQPDSQRRNELVTTDEQLTQISNAITIQHQALYALTDLLTLAPQNIIDFAHKTALIEYLRNEYLRCCGPTQSYSVQQRQNRDGGSTISSNALLAIAGASKNERHRRTIIRLFGLMGAIDPSKGNFSKTTPDSSSIIVEGEQSLGSNKKNGHSDKGPDNHEPIPKTSARSRDMILRNVQDLRRETYQFSGEANYSVTVYRMISKLIAEPEGVSDQALDAALKVSHHLFTDGANEKIQGWDLFEALMELVRSSSSKVSSQVRLQALNLLPQMIRQRAAVAGQLVREFFATILTCWDPSNEQTFLPLLAIVEELHRVNLEASESFSGSIRLDSSNDGKASNSATSLPFALGVGTEADDGGRGASLYLRLVDVAMRDNSPTRDVSHKIISILGYIRSQTLMAPVIVSTFVDYSLTHVDCPIDLRVELLRMLLALTYRFGIMSCITPIVGIAARLLEELVHGPTLTLSMQTCKDLTASVSLISGIQTDSNNVATQTRFSTVGSSVHAMAQEVLRLCKKLLQRAAANPLPVIHSGGVANIAGMSSDDTFSASSHLHHGRTHSNDGIRPKMFTAHLTNSSSSNMADANPLDVIVLHINKAYNGMKKGAGFEWTQWFFSFQQHVLLHCPHIALRVCYDLFNLHEPLRKTLFYPAFHCLLVTVLRSAAASNFGPLSASSPVSEAEALTKRNVAHAIGNPLRRVLTSLLRFGDSESVDMCLGLHDYLEHFRNPNSNDTSASNTIGAMFTAATPHRFEEDDEDGRGGHTLPNIQSQRQISAGLRRTAQAHSLLAAASLPPVPSAAAAATDDAKAKLLLSDSKVRGAKPPVSPTKAEDEEFARIVNEDPNQQQTPPLAPMSGARTPPLEERQPWSLFRTEDLIRAALEHRLHYKAVRYLENNFPVAIKASSRNPPTQPGRGISNGAPKSAAAIRGPSQFLGDKVNPAMSRQVQATVGVVNQLAQQYSRVSMQSSVEGLYSSVQVGVDATGFELLQCWPEANSVYKQKIAQYESEFKAFNTARYSNPHGLLASSEPAPASGLRFNNSFGDPLNEGSPLTPIAGRAYASRDDVVDSGTASGHRLVTVGSTEISHRNSPFQDPSMPRSLSPFQPITPNKDGPLMAHSASSALTSQPKLSPTTAPALRPKDVEGYLRTLCFCGAWDEGLAFARDKFGLLREASNAADDHPSATTTTRGRSSSSIANNKDENKKAAKSRLAIADSAVMCASLCAVIMNQWDDVKRFSELIQDSTNRLLFSQIRLAHTEIANFGSVLSPNGSMVAPAMSDLDSPTAPTPALLLEIENNLARALISVDNKLKSVLPLSYTHAYEIIAKLQHFQEVEEARLYRRRDSSLALQDNIKHMWFQRFQCMKPDAISMLTSIVIYCLAAPPHDVPEAVYHFSKAVRHTHPQLGTWAMSSLQADSLQPNTKSDRRMSNPIEGMNGNNASMHTPISVSLVNPQQFGDVQVDYCEYLWSTGGTSQRERAIEGLRQFLSSPDAVEFSTISLPSELVHQTGLQHIGRAHLLLGQWKQEVSPDRFWKRENREEILKHLNESIHMVPQEYITWHNWALMNYRVQQRDTYLKPEERKMYVERAHRGFVAAICRSDRPKVVIQDIMRLLQLWIIYGGVDVLGEAVVDAIHRISSSLWATCTPQVVAHLGNDCPPIWAVVRSVLEKTLHSFPQLCVFQLLVPILSDLPGVGSRLRPSRARMLLNIACPTALANEARAVAEGLVQLAMFPLEFIRDRIGQALKILRSVEPPLQDLELEAIRVPVRQALVVSEEKADALTQVGPVCQVIHELLNMLTRRGDRDFVDARNYCERLYNELQDHVKELKSICLTKSTTPKLALANLRNLSIWVPGEYTPHRKTAPTIYGFVDRVEVLESKRRPRRMHIVGSDGNINTYCLKGNEDVRVDARAMQLFWLVNSFSTELQPISRFPVIPLTEDVGLLGWVHESETLYNTIRTFRTRAGIRNDPEMDVINTEFAPPSDINRFAHLTVLQRTDLFEHLFAKVESRDMAHVLWYRSLNAELWLKRRTRFTTSLATMSTAGYILGLGDRHPGNLLIQMATGAVVHIDFGDCFDVARYRSSFPETVPFRLTPMLVNAMEIFGVSGAFQATCEASMASMRTNRDSIVALLSAFVYDPVIDKRISQHHGGNVQGVLDQVRRKLRGMEMPPHYYKQNAQSTSWKLPAMSEATGRTRNNNGNNDKLSPARRQPSSMFVMGTGEYTNTSNFTVQNSNLPNLFSPTGSGGATGNDNDVDPKIRSPSAAMPQHTIDPDADEVMANVLDNAADLIAAEAHDNNIDVSTTAPTKREAAVRGEEHMTWALQPRPDLPFVLSQAGSERAMKIAGVPRESLNVKEQMQVLIQEATKCENLSALFSGWTAWW